MYLTILVTHIAFGLVSIFLCLAALVCVFMNKQIKYRKWMYVIGILSALSVVSGGILLFTVPTFNFVKVCASFGVYLMVVVVTQSVLNSKLNKANLDASVDIV